MKIVEASDTRAFNRLLARREGDDRPFERRVQRIVDEVRTGGDRALARFAKEFDCVSGPLEVTRKEMREGAARVDPAVRQAIARLTAGSTRAAPSRISFGVTSSDPVTRSNRLAKRASARSPPVRTSSTMR